MKVYRVEPDVTNYQQFLPENEDFWKKHFYFDCAPLINSWIPPSLYCFNPLKKRANFHEFTPGTFLITPETLTDSIVPMHLEMAGELLKTNHDNEVLMLMNVTQCVNSLNQNLTQWTLIPETGEKLFIQKYCFHPNRFSESSLFKIPETRRAEILTYEISADPEEEFKAAVEAAGMKGLTFQEIWNSNEEY